MELETITRTIQLIIAPVVMVSACALLLNGLLARYGSINDRLRALARERLDLLRRGKQANPLDQGRIGQIDSQLPLLLRHHRLTHDAVLLVYIAAALFIADMFVIGLGTAQYADWIGLVVVGLFLAGILALLAGVLLTAMEVRTSHQAIDDEVRGMMELKGE